MSRPISLIGCGELKPMIMAVLRGWQIREVASGGSPLPIIEIEKTDKGYRRKSPWVDKPAVFTDGVDAVCDFLVDLIRYHISDGIPQLCLHCAAAAFTSDLMIFPSAYEAGKSTLSVHLAAHGARLFADDVLPLENSSNNGIAPGILPRLRLPLADDAGKIFHDFVARRQGLQNDRFLYVGLKENELAPLGTTAPIRNIIMLKRDPGGKTELVPAKKSDTLRDSIMRNFSGNVPAIKILDRLHAVVESARCYALHYTSGDDGARVLRDAFARE
ncbi:MAG: hypothetical protein A3G18_09965 [Rhodospirillales bacterium RIFCSPLOWO2_12_FULL_58_28]|nr:MAG: hypothetical protein A3H92_08140 [Rhodospirillales bacterium RIFCSPLOWO2_02_FULL_58_16]OHC77608.1 MAG: hypothetical protein A3G18_09965 [Rhodospirillales bacterium RIFCSPLOWO2_12_FULL_58_28]